MAHGVKSDSVLKLHQALHGYTDGHRQLALSTTLKPRDTKIMMVLSDLSGRGAQIDEAGYLTGYPLVDSKMYAIARTWPALEMSRPGCVWTHTLLIDFADYASVKDIRSLLSLFKRPSAGSTAEYGVPLGAQVSDHDVEICLGAELYLRVLLAALYGSPTNKIIAYRPNDVDIELVVAAILGQQWPRLKRAFRFCTLAASDRSSEGALFDLQFLPALDRSIRTRFSGAIEAATLIDSEPWLEYAVKDLMHPDANGLRTFFRNIGSDVVSGRESFRILCHLHALIQRFATEPETIDAAVKLLELDFGSIQSRTANGIVASAALLHSNQLEVLPIDFLLRNFDLIDPCAVAQGSEKLGHEIWRQRPSLFPELIENGERQRFIAESALRSLREEDLISGMAQSQDLAKVVLPHRPDLMKCEKFWCRDLVPVDLAFSLIAENPTLNAEIVAAIISAGRADLCSKVISEVGPLLVLKQLAIKFQKPGDEPKAMTNWLRPAISDVSVLAQFLAEQEALSWNMLSAIAAQISPDAVPNDYGNDPWVLAVKSAARFDQDVIPVCLAVFLLTRALGWRSRNPGELVQIGFEPTHNAASSNEMSDFAWNLIKSRLPRSISWFDWDRCPRIRAGVADLFVERGLPPNLFVNVTQDNRLFSGLAESASRNYHGRKYLKHVRSWMKDSGEEVFCGRIRIIEKLINW